MRPEGAEQDQRVKGGIAAGIGKYGIMLCKFQKIDHPATQAWKRRRLGEAGIAVPEGLAFVPVDFERDRLMEKLAPAGLDPESRTFFMWLGVVPYLVEETVFSTLATIGSLSGGAEVTFDYADPPATLSEMQLAAHLERAARVAALGEPWLSYFEPAYADEQ